MSKERDELTERQAWRLIEELHRSLRATHPHLARFKGVADRVMLVAGKAPPGLRGDVISEAYTFLAGQPDTLTEDDAKRRVDTALKRFVRADQEQRGAVRRRVKYHDEDGAQKTKEETQWRREPIGANGFVGKGAFPGASGYKGIRGPLVSPDDVERNVALWQALTTLERKLEGLTPEETSLLDHIAAAATASERSQRAITAATGVSRRATEAFRRWLRTLLSAEDLHGQDMPAVWERPTTATTEADDAAYGEPAPAGYLNEPTEYARRSFTTEECPNAPPPAKKRRAKKSVQVRQDSGPVLVREGNVSIFTLMECAFREWPDPAPTDSEGDQSSDLRKVQLTDRATVGPELSGTASGET